MGNTTSASRSSTVAVAPATDEHIARRLRALRTERQWSLEELAQRSGVSRGTLSRMENAEVSPTTSTLAKLCGVYGLTLSRLLRMVEEDFTPLVPQAVQSEWHDRKHGFTRRSVSPPARTLSGEVLRCTLDAGQAIAYDEAPRPGQEHHLYLLAGALTVTLEGDAHRLRRGDCLRYQLWGASRFETGPRSGAEYLLVLI